MRHEGTEQLIGTSGVIAELSQEIDRIARELGADGVTVLYDDREKVSPGVKFKDAELIGVPTIVVIGRNLADGTIEVRDRRTGERHDVPVDHVVNHVVRLVQA